MKVLINEKEWLWTRDHKQEDLLNATLSLDKIYFILDMGSIKNQHENKIDIRSNIDYDPNEKYYGYPLVTELNGNRSTTLFTNYSLARVYAYQMKNYNQNFVPFIGTLYQQDSSIENLLITMRELNGLNSFSVNQAITYNLNDYSKEFLCNAAYKNMSKNQMYKCMKTEIKMPWYDEMNFVGNAIITYEDDQWNEMRDAIEAYHLNTEEYKCAVEDMIKCALKFWTETYVMMPNKMFGRVKHINSEKLAQENDALVVFRKKASAEFYASQNNMTIFKLEAGDIKNIAKDFANITKKNAMAIDYSNTHDYLTVSINS